MKKFRRTAWQVYLDDTMAGQVNLSVAIQFIRKHIVYPAIVGAEELFSDADDLIVDFTDPQNMAEFGDNWGQAQLISASAAFHGLPPPSY